MPDFLMPLVVFAFGGILLKYTSRQLTPWERRLLWYSFAGHLLAVYAGDLVARFYYGGSGDRFMYHNIGGVIASHLRTDFWEIAPRLLELLFQQGGEELVPFGANTSTGSMQATAAILDYLLGGSLIGSCALVSLCSLFAKLTIYRVFRCEIPRRHWKAALVATMLVPSVLFWSSGLLKESVAISFLAMMVGGAHSLVSRSRWISGLLMVALGAVGVSLFKPYLLIPFGFGAGVWFYVDRAQLRNSGALLQKPLHFVLAALAAYGTLVAISTLFPRYDYQKIQEQLMQEQERGADQTEAGSHFRIDTQPTKSTLRQVLLAPWAIFTALFRPMIFEARSPLAFANALETLVLTILFYLVLVRRGFKRSIREVRESPLLSFCCIFTLFLAIGVGMSSTNMGTMSRYRMPLVPFLVVSLTILGERRASPRFSEALRRSKKAVFQPTR